MFLLQIRCEPCMSIQAVSKRIWIVCIRRAAPAYGGAADQDNTEGHAGVYGAQPECS